MADGSAAPAFFTASQPAASGPERANGKKQRTLKAGRDSKPTPLGPSSTHNMPIHMPGGGKTVHARHIPILPSPLSSETPIVTSSTGVDSPDWAQLRVPPLPAGDASFIPFTLAGDGQGQVPYPPMSPGVMALLADMFGEAEAGGIGGMQVMGSSNVAMRSADYWDMSVDATLWSAGCTHPGYTQPFYTQSSSSQPSYTQASSSSQTSYTQASSPPAYV